MSYKPSNTATLSITLGRHNTCYLCKEMGPLSQPVYIEMLVYSCATVSNHIINLCVCGVTQCACARMQGEARSNLRKLPEFIFHVQSSRALKYTLFMFHFALPFTGELFHSLICLLILTSILGEMNIFNYIELR